MSDNDLNTWVRNALREWMQERGLNQRQVAAELGRSQDYVSGRLRGDLPLSLDIIGAVAALSHISPRALWIELSERAGQ